MNAITTYREAASYINSFINLERGYNPFTKRTYRLDRMEFLLQLFGNPENSFASIHIAGSKGKGSTAVLFAAALQASGCTVGLFTSPHVTDIRERIRVNFRPIGISFFLSVLNMIKQVLDPLPPENFPGEIQPTFFEMMSLIGLISFREKQCRYCVIETGLGGRLDATNVIHPIATLLTPIEREHEDILGDTLEKIAGEKCGIIKPGIPVFSSAQDATVRDIIKNRAAEKKSAVVFVDDEIEELKAQTTLEGTAVRVKLRSLSPREFSLALLGDFQAENAALVMTAFERVFPEISWQDIRKGFAAAQLPGRMEIVKKNPLIIIDGAHTPGSIARVSSTVRELLVMPRVLLFAAVLGKKHREMAEILSPLFAWIIVSTPGSFKKSNPREVYEAFKDLHPNVSLEEEPAAALARARRLSSGTHPIFVTGSFYFIAEIKKLLRTEK